MTVVEFVKMWKGLGYEVHTRTVNKRLAWVLVSAQTCMWLYFSEVDKVTR